MCTPASVLVSVLSAGACLNATNSPKSSVEWNRLNFGFVDLHGTRNFVGGLMNTKLTTKSQEALAAALQNAATDGHPKLEPAHLLLALLADPAGIAGGLLDAL